MTGPGTTCRRVYKCGCPCTSRVLAPGEFKGDGTRERPYEYPAPVCGLCGLAHDDYAYPPDLAKERCAVPDREVDR